MSLASTVSCTRHIGEEGWVSVCPNRGFDSNERWGGLVSATLHDALSTGPVHGQRPRVQMHLLKPLTLLPVLSMLVRAAIPSTRGAQIRGGLQTSELLTCRTRIPFQLKVFPKRNARESSAAHLRCGEQEIAQWPRGDRISG